MRLLVVALAALGLVAALIAGFVLLPRSEGAGLSRKDMAVGFLALGVLALAATGFDMRDWF